MAKIDSGYDGYGSISKEQATKFSLKIYKTYENSYNYSTSGHKMKNLSETQTIIQFQNNFNIPIIFRVSDVNRERILIGVTFLYKTRAWLNFEENILKLIWNNKVHTQKLFI
ncbi:9013_t:CDS:1 [Gigaspora margarita]|uniref:9013_t:CDS:1 n=1 Tax=Gigaspora margarita TaxID=4874 RepID=A0ABN7VK74_GIGMA|nr:9013_t:CDS:1 [Gigaspora margarita]